MSEYNKTILTNAGIDLARRANKGTATFQLTRGVSSTDNLSGKTVEELQNLTQLPSVQQSVILSDVVNTTDNPDTVLGIRMTFDNQNLKTGYNVHTVGIYAKEPGKSEILYGVATAKTPEYIPDFGEQTLFKFDFLMYLVIGRTDKVTVQVSPDDVYRKKDTYNKAEIDAKVSDAVSQLNNKDAEILKNLNDYKQENKTYHQNLEQQINRNLDTKADKSTVNQQLSTKADKSTTYTKVEVDNRISPKADKSYVDGELSTKADKATTYTKDEVNNKIAGQVKSVNGHRADSNGEVTLPKLTATTLIKYDVKNKVATFDKNAGFDGNGYFSRWPVDQGVIGQLADAINAQLPIEEGPANADLLMNAGSKIVYWPGNGDAVKNLPPMNNKKFFFAVKLFDTNWGSVTVVDQDGTYWLNTKNGDIWAGWRSVTTNETLKKLKFVKQSVNQNGDTFQDTKFVTQEADGTFKINIYDSDWTASKVSWLLKNTQSYNISANTNLNDVKAPGLYHCSGTSNIVNVPGGEDSWFNMVVNSDNWNGSQAFYATNSNQLYIRTWNIAGFKQWHKVINDEDYNNLLTSKADKANTYTRNEIEGKLSGKSDKSNTYTKSEVDDKLSGKVNTSDFANRSITSITDYDVGAERWNNTQTSKFNSSGNFANFLVDAGALKPIAHSINVLNANVLMRSGGSMNKGSWITWNGSGANSATDGQIGGLIWNGATDNIKIFGDNNIADNLDLAIQLGDDNSNHVSFRRANGDEVAAIFLDGRYTGTIDWTNVNGRPDINNANPVVTVINSFDVANVKEGPHQTWPVKQPWLVDQMALHPFADAINALNTNLSTLRTELMNLKRRVDYNSPQGEFNNTTVNINDLRSTGIYRFANCYIQNGPYPTNNTHWIYLQVTVFDADTVYQTLYEGDNMYGRKSSSPTNWGKWHKYLNQEV